MLMIQALLALMLQDPTPSPAPPALDWRNEIAAGITLLTPVVVRVLSWGAFFLVDKIPKWAFPTAAVVVGTGIDFFSGLNLMDPMLGALAVVASIGLREILDRYFMQGLGLKKALPELTRSVDNHVVAAGALAKAT